MNEIVLAIVLGALFGFVLHRIGAADGDKLINMLRLRDTELMKTILLGIGIAATLIFTSNALGILDIGHFDIKALNVGVIVGGIIFGIGWAVAGYCPGTAVSGIGAGKKDAVVYVLGGLVGAYLFSQTYKIFNELGWFEKILGDTVALINVSEDIQGLIPVGNIGGIVFGVILIGIAIVLPKKMIKDTK